MENLALELVNEVTESNGFIVNDDKSAEWALKKIAEEKKELQKIEMTIDSIVAEYQFKKQQAKERFESKTAILKNQLQAYFQTVEHKSTKTQETYSLPSGKLKLKYGTVEYIRDEEILVKWLKTYNPKFIKIEESPMWKELKETLTFNVNSAITTDGEVVPGVKVQRKPDTFEIEI